MWSIGICITFTLLEGLIFALIYSVNQNQGLCYFLTYLLTLLIIILKFKKSLIQDLKNIKKDIKGNIFKLFLFYLIFIICMYISNYILYSSIGNIASNEETIRESLFKSPLLMALSVCLLGPIMEELIYRYPFKDIKGNKILIFIIYTLLFASLHITTSTSLLNLLYIIPYIFLSLSFGYSFYKTNNILTSMFFHILNNTFSVIIILTLGG